MFQTPAHLSASVLPVPSSRAHSVPPVPAPASSAWSRPPALQIAAESSLSPRPHLLARIGQETLGLSAATLPTWAQWGCVHTSSASLGL